MSEILTPDILVIGGGSGGLSVAAGAAQLGASTILLEGGRMGGDCLNTGCVPSKALLRTARAAHDASTAGRFGIETGPVSVDFARAHAHVQQVIAAIEPHDSVPRFEGLGVKVIQAYGRFIDDRTVEAGNQRIRAKRVVIATGSHAAVPPVPGLDSVPFLTNETVFELRECPAHLLVLGGGPIGIEMAQAHRRLGARVTVLEIASIMVKDDPELVDVVRQQLRREGIDLIEGCRVVRIENHENGLAAIVTDADGGNEHRIAGSHLLVAAGRRPNIERLDLDAAGIRHTRAGITVDDRLRTSNRRVLAIGDVAGGPQFTHVAGYHAGIVIRNLLFRLPARVDYRALPWVTYSAPELAHTGMTEAMAREQYGRDGFGIARWSFHENDRAQAEGATDGMVKVIVVKDRVVGASIVGPHAGELIQTWCLAIQQRLKLGDIAGLIAPYPTLAEINKRAAGSFFLPRLFSDKTRRLVRLLLKLP